MTEDSSGKCSGPDRYDQHAQVDEIDDDDDVTEAERREFEQFRRLRDRAESLKDLSNEELASVFSMVLHDRRWDDKSRRLQMRPIDEAAELAINRALGVEMEDRWERVATGSN